jgi:hypothetical protein
VAILVCLVTVVKVELLAIQVNLELAGIAATVVHLDIQDKAAHRAIVENLVQVVILVTAG